MSVIGVLQTAAPFLLALAVLTLLSRPWVNHSRIWPTGILVWIGTVALGLALRVLFGATAAVPFIIVATIVLGVFLVGPPRGHHPHCPPPRAQRRILN